MFKSMNSNTYIAFPGSRPLAVLLSLSAAFLLNACGDGQGKIGLAARSARASYVYQGAGEEWDTHAVPGAPYQTKPIYSRRARPPLTTATALRPSVYYIPKINAADAAASSCTKYSLGDGWQICMTSLEDCLLQGSCFVGLENGWRFFMRAGAKRELRERHGLRCRFGAGSHACLSPYVSVAADHAFHKPGDVIYVPSLDGKRVPYLGTHDGFLVVHDKGGAIRGAERFDIFTGHQGVRDPENALARWGYGDKNSRSFKFVKVPAHEASIVLREKGLQL
jgi:3D (Asp-Asp-Asp) domain-containing protein